MPSVATIRWETSILAIHEDALSHMFVLGV